MPTDVPRPLVDPFPDPAPSWLERVCLFVPVLGWMVAAVLEVRRRTPKESAIDAQIAARTEETLAAWGEDPQRRRVAAVVSEAIRDEFGWSNANFLPDDPIGVLWFSVGWLGGEPLAVLVRLDLRLGVNLMRRRDTEYSRMTLGEFVDLTLRLSPRLADPAKV